MIPRSLVVFGLALILSVSNVFAGAPAADPSAAPGAPVPHPVQPVISSGVSTRQPSSPVSAKTVDALSPVPAQAQTLVHQRLEHRRRIDHLENELELTRLMKDIAALQRECQSLGVRCAAGTIEPIAADPVTIATPHAADPLGPTKPASLPPPTVVAIHNGRATLATDRGVLLVTHGARLPGGYAVRSVNLDDVVFEHARMLYRVPVHWAPRTQTQTAPSAAASNGTVLPTFDVNDLPPPPPPTR